jgi:hypothetical protein
MDDKMATSSKYIISLSLNVPLHGQQIFVVFLKPEYSLISQLHGTK